jgi:class 3 adenylate cyclase
MEPRIEFARASDGVSVAYYELGTGYPVVYGPGSMSNVGSEVRDPGRREWYESLAQHCRLIRYDRRGTGMSERRVTDYSVEALLLDLEALADHLKLETFALIATGWSGPVGIAYAAAHTERVSRLILYGTNATGRSSLMIHDESAALLLAQDWELFTELLARQWYEWPDTERIRAEAARIRESVTQDGMKAFLDATRTWDVSRVLPRLQCPTLVLYRPEWANRGGMSATIFELNRAMAQAIPGARLVALSGSQLAPYTKDSPEMRDLILPFLGEAEGGMSGVTTASTFGTTIILFADIVDSTALTERMGDAAFRDRARTLDASLRGIISGAGGTAIDGKLLGDGVLATFPAASQAIDAALRCASAGDEQSLPLHLGLHAGDVIREQNNVFGGAVNVASRISGLSAPGEVLVSDVVRALARTSASVTFEDRGEHALKGVGDPQRVYAVRASRTGDDGGA